MAKSCNSCKHLQKGVKCAAFPKGIPMAFASGDVEHTEVVGGQVGTTVYEPKVK